MKTRNKLILGLTALVGAAFAQTVISDKYWSRENNIEYGEGSLRIESDQMGDIIQDKVHIDFKGTSLHFVFKEAQLRMHGFITHFDPVNIAQINTNYSSPEVLKQIHLTACILARRETDMPFYVSDHFGVIQQRADFARRNCEIY